MKALLIAAAAVGARGPDDIKDGDGDVVVGGHLADRYDDEDGALGVT